MQYIILFGQPGSGKSYIGRLLQKEYGYTFIDGDSELTDEMIEALNTSKPITTAMRDVFMERLLTKFQQTSLTHSHVVLSQTFIQDQHRKLFYSYIPSITFLLVTAKDPKRETRYMKRKTLAFTLEYLRTMVSLFEPITVPYRTITNNSDGPRAIRLQLNNLGIRKK